MKKAVTGNTIQRTNVLTNHLDTIPLYRWERSRYCTRCGVEVHKEGHKG